MKPSARAEIQALWASTDALFNRLPDWQARPIDLRHPFLFYIGHLAAFAWNMLGDGRMSAMDRRFAFGIDPESPAPEAEWPPITEVLAYRDQLRERLLGLDPPDADLAMVIEHELMHHETLLYMVQAAGWALEEEVLGGPGQPGEPIELPGGRVRLGAEREALRFCWDNELPPTVVEVAPFEIDSLAVRNSDWLRFVDAGGPRPRSWIGDRVRSLAGPQPLERVLGWPVQVSGEQAAAYAAWKGRRLPTEPECACFRPQAATVNAGGESLCPVPVGGSSGPELVGNGWEWTSTPFAGFPGFTPIHPRYQGYSQDFFGGAHRVVIGASPVTPAVFLRPSFRNWYRADYPWVFSKFRTARSLD